MYHPISMLGNRTHEQWISQYSSSHQHPVNRACHTLGIPTILLSLPLFLVSIFFHRLWPYALGLFLAGWILQFIGHAFEGKPPEFFQDSRVLPLPPPWRGGPSPLRASVAPSGSPPATSPPPPHSPPSTLATNPPQGRP